MQPAALTSCGRHCQNCETTLAVDEILGWLAVFVGEVDEGKVVGFHNWIQFYLEERAGRVNYLGHLLPRGR